MRQFLLNKLQIQNYLNYSRTTNFILSALFLISLTHIAVALLEEVQFSPDSWSYYELSKSIFHDFYRINTYRHFQNEIPYGMSFPPLWPIIINILDSATSLGIYTGYFANFLIVFLTAWITERTVRHLFGIPGAGFLSLSILLWYEPFVDEVTGARSIPLALLWLAFLLHFFTVESAERKSVAFIAGVTAGLAVMTRFDLLLATLSLVVPYMLLKRRLSSAGIYLIGWIAAISPWVAFSVKTFGVAFATDNARVARSAQTDFVTNFLIDPIPTITEAPVQWFVKCLDNFIKIYESIKWEILLPVNLNTFVLPILGFLVCMMAASFALKWRFLDYLRIANDRSRQLNSLSFGLVFLVHLFGPIATGYPDVRYFSPAIWFSTIIALRTITPRTAGIFIPSVTIILLISLNIKLTLDYPIQISNLTLDKKNITPVEFKSLTECIPSNSRVLFVGNNRVASKFGALTGYQVAYEPGNLKTLSPNERQIFLTKFKLRYLAVVDESSRVRAHSFFNLSLIKNCEDQVFKILSALR